MTDDAKLIERLRAWADTGDFGRGPDPDDLRRQAASRIEALIAERDRAYERAAEVADLLADKAEAENMCRGASVHRKTATAIRSLKDKTDAE